MPCDQMTVIVRVGLIIIINQVNCLIRVGKVFIVLC